MDTLPPEITGEIIRIAMDDLEWVLGERRPQYATVSREWQVHVERILFETIYLNMGSRRLSESAEIMTLRRQSYVRTIYFTIQLPKVENLWVRSEEEKASEALFTQLAGMLRHLRTWNMPSGKIELILWHFGGRQDPYDWRGLFELESDTYRQLPQVHSITKFVITGLSWVKPKTCYWRNAFQATCTYTVERNLRSAETIFRNAPASEQGLQYDVEDMWCAAARAHLGKGAVLRFGVGFEGEDLHEENRVRHLVDDESSEPESEGAEHEAEVDFESEWPQTDWGVTSFGGEGEELESGVDFESGDVESGDVESGDTDEIPWDSGYPTDLEKTWARNPKWTHTEEMPGYEEDPHHFLEWTQTV